MDDLMHNQAKFSNTILELRGCITKLENELASFNHNYNVIKRNWSGTEFDKATLKLEEIKNTLEKAITDNNNQIKYYENQNDDFASIHTGL